MSDTAIESGQINSDADSVVRRATAHVRDLPLRTYVNLQNSALAEVETDKTATRHLIGITKTALTLYFMTKGMHPPSMPRNEEDD